MTEWAADSLVAVRLMLAGSSFLATGNGGLGGACVAIGGAFGVLAARKWPSRT